MGGYRVEVLHIKGQPRFVSGVQRWLCWRLAAPGWLGHTPGVRGAVRRDPPWDRGGLRTTKYDGGLNCCVSSPVCAGGLKIFRKT